MDFMLDVMLVLIIPFCPCFGVEVSKACYGSERLCTKHNLRCSSGRIAIQKAFYTNSTDCGIGVSACVLVNTSSISLTGKPSNFNDTELGLLYRNCSTQYACSFPAPRRHRGSLYFSVFKYKCVNEIYRKTTPVPNQENDTKAQKSADSNIGTIIGIIIPLCIIIAGVATVVIIFRRRKLQRNGGNGKVTEPTSTPLQIYPSGKTSSPDFGYARANDYLDLALETQKLRSPQNADAISGLPESHNSSESKNDKLNIQITKELSSSEYNLASKMESHDVKTLSGKKGSSEYVLAGNISRGKESQQAKKGSSDYDYTGDNTYHVLERQSALRDSSDYDYAGGNDYHEVEPQESNTSDYDYATCGKQQANDSSTRNTQTRDSDNDHFGREPANANVHHETTLSVAGTSEGIDANEEVYSYNHLNEKAVSNANADSTYNTSSSTRHKIDSSSNDIEDDYGYNHLGTECKKSLPQNEYDTTASAIRDVARMNGDMEDSTYDHAHLLTSDSSPSGMTNAGFQESDYDHASLSTTAHKDEYESNASRNRSHQDEGGADVKTLAGEAEPNPYQLAK